MQTLLISVLLCIAILSFIPVRFSRGWRILPLTYPFLALLCAALYEVSVRAQLPRDSVPVRIDLLLGLPVLAFILVSGICRWLIYLFLNRKQPRPERLIIGLQLCAVCLTLSLCSLWARPNWDYYAMLSQSIWERLLGH